MHRAWLKAGVEIGEEEAVLLTETSGGELEVGAPPVFTIPPDREGANSMSKIEHISTTTLMKAPQSPRETKGDPRSHIGSKRELEGEERKSRGYTLSQAGVAKGTSHAT